MEYTKGELGGWRNQGGTIMTDSHNKRKVIARVENNKTFTVKQVIANAHLIAAAPDLYEAIKELIRRDEYGSIRLPTQASDIMRKAIVKAES